MDDNLPSDQTNPIQPTNSASNLADLPQSQPGDKSTSTPTNDQADVGAAGAGVSLDKERGSWGAVETGDLTSIEQAEPELPKETEGWLEKLEKGEAIKLPQPVTDDQNQVVLDDIDPKVEKLELPLTEVEINQGLHFKIWNSFRWLAAWCARIVKMGSDKFIYRKAEASDQ